MGDVENLKLSEDAEYLARNIFWYAGKLTFQEVESKPTARTQAALDELVDTGILTVEPFNRFGGKVYTRVKEVFKKPATQKMHDTIGKGFTITEKIEK